MRTFIALVALAAIGTAIYFASVRWLGLEGASAYVLAGSGACMLLYEAICVIDPTCVNNGVVGERYPVLGCTGAVFGPSAASWILASHFLPWNPTSWPGTVGFYGLLVFIAIVSLTCHACILLMIADFSEQRGTLDDRTVISFGSKQRGTLDVVCPLCASNFKVKRSGETGNNYNCPTCSGLVFVQEKNPMYPGALPTVVPVVTAFCESKEQQGIIEVVCPLCASTFKLMKPSNTSSIYRCQTCSGMVLIQAIAPYPTLAALKDAVATPAKPSKSVAEILASIQPRIGTGEDAASLTATAATSSLTFAEDPSEPSRSSSPTNFDDGAQAAKSTSSSETPAMSAESTNADHKVFICHSSRDSKIAEMVCATLENHGVRCWMAPRDVMAGIPYADALIDALSSSRVLILVYSSNSNVSPQVAREVERAVSKGASILPLRIEDVEMSKSMEYFISTSHWFDAVTRPLESQLSRLAETVNLLLAKLEGNLSSKQMAVGKTLQQTAAKVRTDGEASASADAVHDAEVFQILLDSLCCVMSADGIATSSEKLMVHEIMQRLKMPFGSDEIDNGIENFCDRVAAEGLSDVVGVVLGKANAFKQLGKSELLKKCLHDVAHADGKLQKAESDMIDRFQSVID